MKLAKNLSFAAAGVALSLAAVSAKPAQAATVQFTGGSFNYQVLATGTSPETLGAGSFITLAGLQGVNGVTVGSAFSTPAFTSNLVTLAFNSATAATTPGTPFAGSQFSIQSSSPSGLIPFVTFNTSNSGVSSGTTTGPAVPEPMTVGGSLLAIGFGTWMKRKKAVSA